MNSIKKIKSRRALIFLTALAVVGANASIAEAASKTITCYKGTSIKKVTAAKPKCATGWSTKKPVAVATSKGTSIAFSGTYKGQITMVWSSSNVKATIKGTGTGDTSGLADLTGVGTAAPQSQCEAINGTGTLGSGTNTIALSVVSTAKGCAEEAAAPTDVNVSGNATVTGGTGKFAGASGTLKLTGYFSVKSTTAGTTDNSTFTVKIEGNVVTK
jgi:hypothetical protein